MKELVEIIVKALVDAPDQVVITEETQNDEQVISIKVAAEDMGKVIGTCNGIETQFIEIRCEQNTHNIHAIQPTLKRINVNSFGGRSRNRTDLVQN